MTEQSHATQGLATSLRSVAAGQRAAVRRARRFALAWGALAGLMAIVLVDPLAPLPAGLRWLLLAALAVGLPAAVILSRRRLPDPPPVEGALRLERLHGLRDNVLVNGLLLSPQLGDDLPGRLAGRAARRADDLATQVDPEGCVDRSASRRQAVRLACVGGVLAALTLLQPGLVGIGVLRLLMPWRDQPPFSLTRMTAGVDPQPPLRGQPATVRVAFSGVIPPSADLVELNDDGHEVRRWPMVATELAAREHRFAGLLEPMTVRVEAGGTWTPALRIVPADPPTPPGVASAPATDSAEQDVATEPQTPLAAPEDAPAELRDLADQAQRIGEQASTPQGDEAALQDRMRQFGEQAAALRQGLEGAESSEQGDAAGSAAWREALGDLRLPALASSGGSQATDTQRGDWQTQVSDAARHDADRLRSAAAGNETGDAETDAGQRAEQDQPDLPQRDPTPVPMGQYDEASGAAQGPERSGHAAAREAPPAYRRLVEAYFNRLAEQPRRSSP